MLFSYWYCGFLRFDLSSLPFYHFSLHTLYSLILVFYYFKLSVLLKCNYNFSHFFSLNYRSRWFHLAFNLIVQLLVGLPLEMVHGSMRIGCVYLAGVLAGSMGTSVFDPEVYLVGASGGVYALLAAHLANVMLNFNNMHYGIIRIVGIFLFGEYKH